MFFHLGYQYHGNGQTKITMCSTHPQVKALFARYGGLAPPPLIDMEVSTHIPNGWTKDVAMETSNLSMEGESISTSQVEGAWNFTPPTNNTEGLNISSNNDIQTFQQVSLPEGLNSAKKQDLDKKLPTFFHEMNIHSMLCDTLHS
jgi:hypothetical protein